MVLNWKKTRDPFIFLHSGVFFVHEGIFEKTASVVRLRPRAFLTSSFAELKFFLDMKLDHHRYYKLSSCVF